MEAKNFEEDSLRPVIERRLAAFCPPIYVLFRPVALGDSTCSPLAQPAQETWLLPHPDAAEDDQWHGNETSERGC
jgi:hypothetical protein